MLDTKICTNCGGLMIRTGTCHTCTQCGDNSGCGRALMEKAVAIGRDPLFDLSRIAGVVKPLRVVPARWDDVAPWELIAEDFVTARDVERGFRELSRADLLDPIVNARAAATHRYARTAVHYKALEGMGLR